MKNGPYELIVVPAEYTGKRYRGRYAYEHMVVWWKNHGVVPGAGFEIHHLNGNHRDNRIKNLRLLTAHEHRKLHGAMQRKQVEFACGFCKKLSRRDGHDYRSHLKNNKSGLVFCSRRCGAKRQHSGRGGK